MHMHTSAPDDVMRLVTAAMQVADLQRRFAIAQAERDNAAAAALSERWTAAEAAAPPDAGAGSRPWTPAAQLPASSLWVTSLVHF